MERVISGFHQDEEGHWVAELSCGHTQHVRHQPPFTLRPWVTTAEGRAGKLGARLDCPGCDRRELPKGFAPYQRTRSFDERSVPKALLAQHDTKAGVWGLIHVTRGALDLVEPEGSGERRERITPAAPGVVRPEVVHRVEPQGEVEFYVEFWRAPAAQATRPGGEEAP